MVVQGMARLQTRMYFKLDTVCTTEWDVPLGQSPPRIRHNYVPPGVLRPKPLETHPLRSAMARPFLGLSLYWKLPSTYPCQSLSAPAPVLPFPHTYTWRRSSARPLHALRSPCTAPTSGPAVRRITHTVKATQQRRYQRHYGISIRQILSRGTGLCCGLTACCGLISGALPPPARQRPAQQNNKLIPYSLRLLWAQLSIAQLRVP